MPLDLNRLLLEEGPHLNFFQAVRLAEAARRGRGGRIGSGDELSSEPVRFETDNSIAFPASDIASVEEGSSAQAEGPLRMALTFMGFYGVSSPLPSYFSDPITLHKAEYLSLKKFLDIFAHRFYSLFYRAWEKHRHPMRFSARGDGYTAALLALVGQWPGKALPGPSGASAMPRADLRRLPYGRYLGHRVRSAKALAQLLQGYFDFPRVRVEEFVLAWVPIPRKTALGAPSCRLGTHTLLGEKMPDRLSRFEVVIGPLPRTLFDRFREDGPDSLTARVKALVDDFLLDPLDYRLRIVLATGEEAAPGLGRAEGRLGQGAWLGVRPREEISLLR